MIIIIGAAEESSGGSSGCLAIISILYYDDGGMERAVRRSGRGRCRQRALAAPGAARASSTSRRIARAAARKWRAAYYDRQPVLGVLPEADSDGHRSY